MNPEATPFDIIGPPAGAIAVTIWHWLILFSLFIFGWVIALQWIKHHRKKPIESFALPPLAEEVKSSGQEFLKAESKDSLNLFVTLFERLVKEYPILLREKLTEQNLQYLKKARYRETLPAEAKESVLTLLKTTGGLRE